MMILNAFSVFLLWSLGAAWDHKVLQINSFQKVKFGETVEMRCHIYSSGRINVWYKLTHNRRLELLASTDVLLNNSTVSIKLRNRFSVKLSPVVSTLKILNAEWGDDGTYYCGVLILKDVTFGSGTALVVEGDSKLMQSVLQSPEYIRVQPGDSVTLSCSFNTSLCPQEHTSVTWIKSGSQTVSWNFENTSMNCEDAGETSCVHNLTLTEVGSAENGTFLCVVTACGNTMLGSGTRIEMYKNQLVHLSQSSIALIVALIVVSVAFVVSVLALVLVSCKKFDKQTPGRALCCLDSPQHNQVEDSVTYAGVRIGHHSATNRGTSIQPKEDTVLYSDVRIKNKRRNK
ncbi:uncharacterized protein LOC129409833 [Boleophthalmus pectinirostris]|uniref:uncharacterized protein LOC129409833 n=1 Tax=Boleophthalmus pectinirostris TaxID=150288 RepID=UPI00242A6353|nr:uncharacterized protein LOC129409833 [Boleophthalmus pectinirostris]